MSFEHANNKNYILEKKKPFAMTQKKIKIHHFFAALALFWIHFFRVPLKHDGKISLERARTNEKSAKTKLMQTPNSPTPVLKSAVQKEVEGKKEECGNEGRGEKSTKK